MKYDSEYEIRLATLKAMGGDVSKHYDSVYEIGLEILKLAEESGGGIEINDNVINTTKTWSSEKITETYEPATDNEIEALFA